MNIAVPLPVIRSMAPPHTYATIALSDHRSAQGPVLRQYLDGRVVIDTGKGRLTGWPLTAAQTKASIWMPLFGSLF